MNNLARRLSYFIPFLLLAGAALLLFFVLLTGGTEGSVLKNWYWLEADTSQIQGAPFQTTRWTSYNVCGVSNGDNTDCSATKAAFPFSPVDNFGTSNGVPQSFIDDRDTYYYLSRIGWAFLLVGLFFTILALFIAPIAMCMTHGIITGGFTTFSSMVALLFTITAACLLTAAYVKGRNAFSDAGYDAHLGVKLFAFLWTAVACLILSSGSLCTLCSLGGLLWRRKNRNYDSESDTYTGYTEPKPVPANANAPPQEPNHGSNINFFRIRNKKKNLDQGVAEPVNP